MLPRYGLRLTHHFSHLLLISYYPNPFRELCCTCKVGYPPCFLLAPSTPYPYLCRYQSVWRPKHALSTVSQKTLASHRAHQSISAPASTDLPSVQTLMKPMLSPIPSLKNCLIARPSRITAVVCLTIPVHVSYV